jgi:hypothetical protein
MTITNATFPSADTGPARNGPVDLPSAPRLPEADMVPSSDDLMARVVQGAHATIDRLADQAAPQVQRLQEGLSTAGNALQGQADQARATSDAWAQSLRDTVRDHPLAAVVSALALGALIARITR